jgi:hypothetical protein
MRQSSPSAIVFEWKNINHARGETALRKHYATTVQQSLHYPVIWHVPAVHAASLPKHITPAAANLHFCKSFSGLEHLLHSFPSSAENIIS